MDEPNKSRLERLRTNNIPRYLFRIWSPASGGGEAGLNSIDQVCSHAFNRGLGHQNIYDMTFEELVQMARFHYRGIEAFDRLGSPVPPTEFSSWAASLKAAFAYVRLTRDTYLAMIDTKVLGDGVKVWHVPHLLEDLAEAGDHEYLAHGIIRGAGYKAVALDRLNEAGLRSLTECSGSPEEILAGCKRVAGLFGDAVAMPLALALLTHIPRRWYQYAEPSREDLDVILEGLKPLEILEDWADTNSIVAEDGVNPGAYEDVERLTILMRVLTEYRYGKKGDEGEGSAMKFEKLELLDGR
ncbi:uncharacterized protein BDZ99DRAFT_539771 [Mytilinidion resinicola]|uniref:Uncharacterized protein n=1 Tax=Mytilinidion resinicola TaxID=574789 RepID=A0A6A6Y9Y7_9PEZI|nr:uncharacterized protein BDZ99DRAFT_539771 [Mytilinidion resinicola]KAF2805439.1 hypothetical protein BDZ99DRAFT_539771 [Mytilinidion resinicola]